MFKKILVAHDGSEGARKAFDVALQFAVLCSSELHMICVQEDLPHYAATLGEVTEAKEEGNRFFWQLAQECTQLAVRKGILLQVEIRAGHEVETIVSYVEQGAYDLLVVGRVGHSSIWKKHTGSTSSQLAFHAPCTIMVVR